MSFAKRKKRTRKRKRVETEDAWGEDSISDTIAETKSFRKMNKRKGGLDIEQGLLKEKDQKDAQKPAKAQSTLGDFTEELHVGITKHLEDVYVQKRFREEKRKKGHNVPEPVKKKKSKRNCPLGRSL